MYGFGGFEGGYPLLHHTRRRPASSPSPRKYDAFPDRAAYSRGLRHAWSMYTGGGCRSPYSALTTRDADEQHSGLLAKWRRQDR